MIIPLFCKFLFGEISLVAIDAVISGVIFFLIAAIKIFEFFIAKFLYESTNPQRKMKIAAKFAILVL
ncbi:unnamed protein product [Blepharisma stoltei]|uniref:Uncharacterized protein n=1 Tax=Blepharisma stoltei TaxID=1481888 RepID=A0AAU9I987_9CILI|nr:unnamed protein product [Blepharisma stoltei]